MRIGLIAKKIGMSRFYDSHGVNQSATILHVDKCKILDIRNNEKNGYQALRLSFGQSEKVSNKPNKGFLKKQNAKSHLTSKEFRVNNLGDYKIGDEIGVDNFEEGQFVDVSGNTIGKGFAGGMKRHNFAGNRATHGVSISHRSHGSTGQCQDPGKVFKGKKMAGRLGNVKRTIQNLLVLRVDTESNLIVLKGSVPGPNGSFLRVIDSTKGKKNIDLKKAPKTDSVVSKPDQKKEVDSNKNNNKQDSEVKRSENENLVVKDDKSSSPSNDIGEANALNKVEGDEGKN
tara:strand:+ start:136 stop:993 length:858 start_codon:yes stop_codon:yes gene_type:complete